MDITTNVKLRLNDQYVFSISQEVDRKGFAEVALLRNWEDGRFAHFVHCGEWCVNWVGEEYDDEVVRFVDAHDVADLLQFAKEYVYIKEHENVQA